MPGIHHVTAICGRAERNLDFYTRILDLRLVKKTVNFDDPFTYHLYFGDESGRPGTILTFFAWEHASPGQAGVGLAFETSFGIPATSIGYWTHRLVEKGVRHEAPTTRFGERVLSLRDADGTRLALVGVAGDQPPGSSRDGEIPREHAIRAVHGVTLMLNNAAATGTILSSVLGFTRIGGEGNVIRYRTMGATVGNLIDIQEAGGFMEGRLGRGSVHHVAFRAKDDAEQAAIASALRDSHGLTPTGQLDRCYFRSIYFREPGGVLFEIATDAPGFAVDEPRDRLGAALQLPPFLEARRQEIEKRLPPLDPQRL